MTHHSRCELFLVVLVPLSCMSNVSHVSVTAAAARCSNTLHVKRAIVSCLPWWHVPIPVRRDVERVLGDHFQNSLHLSGVLYVYSNGPDDDVLRLSISQDCPVDDPRCQVTSRNKSQKRARSMCLGRKLGHINMFDESFKKRHLAGKSQEENCAASASTCSRTTCSTTSAGAA